MTRADSYVRAREDMMLCVKDLVAQAADQLGKESLAQNVLDVMSKVPRHRFVPLLQKPFAYLNRPLPIGMGQTISQPFIVALMLDMLNPKSTDNVLVVGAGSGYQTAILSGLVRQVYSVEIIPELAQAAAHNLKVLNYKNVLLKLGDACQGWSEYAPFDAIVVAAAGEIPPRLLEQLKPGGHMVIPLNTADGRQTLTLVDKDEEGRIATHSSMPVSFVPLVGGA